MTTHKKVVKNQATTSKQLGDDDLTPEEEDILQKIDDWTEFNPQVMMEQTEDCDILFQDINLYMKAITEKYKKSELIETLDTKLEELFNLYTSINYGINQWWKYSHIEE